MPSSDLLSKSRVLAGLQCEKRLYLEIHHPDLRDTSDSADYILEMGRQVGEFARSRYTRGVLVEPGSLDSALEMTSSLADKQGPPLFESTFHHDNILVRTDILHRGSKNRVLTEVKASSRVKDEHYDDCAVQAWVLEGAGYPLDRIELEHVNSDFMYEEEGNYDGVLVAKDITEDVRPIMGEVESWVQNCKSIIAGDEPRIEMGKQCKSPHDCPFISHCLAASSGPKYPVSELPHAGKLVASLLEEGIEDIRDIPDGPLEKPVHIRMRKAILAGEAVIENEALQLLQALPYPRFYLDFETISFTIPVWLGTSPYEALPFQWSCHHEKKRGGKLHHDEFLDVTGKPPMRDFTESLLEILGNEGPIFVYSPYEKRILREAALRFPEHEAAIEAVIERLVDLWDVAKKCYYHPGMHGSWSIKKVLPTIAPELDYGSLNVVHNGTEAQAAYIECISSTVSDERRQSLDKSLKKYCELDTLAMVKIAKFFESEQ